MSGSLSKGNGREHFSSRLTLILSASGAAVGLGNIQRFPYMVSEGGGALFVLLYILCLLILGIPLILVEFSVGQSGQGNPVLAIRRLSNSKYWPLIGLFCIAVAFFIFSYYLVTASWTLAFGVGMALGEPPIFDEFVATPQNVAPYLIILAITCYLIVSQGLKKGIERFSKVLMPTLVLLLFGLMVRSLSLPGSLEGLRYYLTPDFTELNGKIFVLALGQAFFSLCIGEAVLITFGSYAKRNENLVASAFSIAFFDTAVALLAGFIIFPAIFSFGLSPAQGVGLIYNVMPGIFLQMPGGQLFGTGFFLLLVLAALTTLIALLEMPVLFLMETYKISRKRAGFATTLLALLLSVPSLLSKGGVNFLSDISIPAFRLKGFYEIMDFLWGSLGMVTGGLLLSIFVGWKWGVSNASAALAQNSAMFKKQNIKKLWGLIVKYVAPAAILTILLSMMWGISS